VQVFVRPPLRARLMAWLPFVATAALASFAIHLALRMPWLALFFAGSAVLVAIPQLAARKRARRLLVSGNVEAVLSAWHGALDRLPHRETMAPLIAATALAANGMTERARAALGRAAKGAAWEAALEHRLFVETLLDAFEGERDSALTKAQQLVALPLPAAGPFLEARIVTLRSAIGALARAFAHATRPGDIRVLRAAARRNPLVHWPMRYAAAVACIDRQELGKARQLLDGAPRWPEDSAFQAFHVELLAELDAAARGVLS
jgi:hypothetical protein